MSMLKSLKIDLESAVEQLKRNKFNGELSRINLDERLAFADAQIAYAVALAEYAVTKNYSALELVTLHRNIQEIALSNLERETCEFTEAILITNRSAPYQLALSNLLKTGLEKANEKDLIHFMALYMTQTAAYNKLPNVDTAANKRLFLDAQRQEFMEIYLDKTNDKSNDFYFRRFKGFISYVTNRKNLPHIGQLTTKVAYNFGFSDILKELTQPLWPEARRPKSVYNLQDVYEVIYEAVEMTKGTPAADMISQVAESIPGCYRYLSERRSCKGRFTAYMNRKITA